MRYADDVVWWLKDSKFNVKLACVKNLSLQEHLPKLGKSPDFSESVLHGRLLPGAHALQMHPELVCVFCWSRLPEYALPPSQLVCRMTCSVISPVWLTRIRLPGFAAEKP